MPSLEQATQPIDRGGLAPVVAPTVAPVALYSQQQYPANPNPFLRSPIPPIAATPDSLRQYYQGGLIPQSRIMTPATIGQTSGSSSSTTTTNQITNTTTVISKVGTVQNVSITTPVLNPGQQYTSTLLTSTAYVPLTVAVTASARVELYATALARTLDLTRSSTTSPGPGTQQGILLDVTIASSPMNWVVTPTLPAANADSPQKAMSYITVTNVGSSSVHITASLQYLVLKL